MKLAIVGSRLDKVSEQVRNRMLKRVEAYVRGLPPDTEIVSGGAPGVDLCAEQTAIRCGLQRKIFRVSREDYRQFGIYAPLRRNSFIVAYCDKLVAFWDGQSKGTRDAFTKARKAGKLLEVFLPEEER